MKKCAVWMLALSLLLTLAACAQKQTPVYVQSVSALAELGGIAPMDTFGGIVVSESVTEIQKDSDKTIEELFVRTGDDVTEGQKLFAYDTEQLLLTLEKQRLQLEQLAASIENYTAQIAQLEKDREKANNRDKLQYTIQIQTNQIDLKEAELNLKTKQSEVLKSEHLLENAVVLSPVTGRVTAVSDSGMDEQGNAQAFITIQKTGSYRVKGTLNEMQRGSIQEGNRIRLESRLDPERFWMGTVTLVDYENPSQGSMGYGMSPDEMGSSSRYPFYVELDSGDGLLLGQHLYLSIAPEETESFDGITLGSSFLCFDEEGNPYVWADNGRGSLEKRAVELGEFDWMQDVYQLLGGLQESDYVAFPDEELCREGVPVTRIQTGREGGVD